MPRSALGLLIVFSLLAAAQPARADSCTVATLVGTWVTDWDKTESWTFVEGGELLCAGFCDYGRGIGRPQSWEDEPHANLWSRSLQHIRLIFTEHRFEGTTGGFRCEIEKDGQELRLDPMRGDPLTLSRQ